MYGRFLEPEARKAFFEAYKEIEALWEILSPSAELREYYKPLLKLPQDERAHVVDLVVKVLLETGA